MGHGARGRYGEMPPADLIAPEPTPRPRACRRPVPADIIDAEFEEITVPARETAPACGARTPLTAAATPPSRRTGWRHGGRVSGFAVLVVALSVFSFWVCGGGRAATRLLRASALPPPQLTVSVVASRFGVAEGLPVAFVNGRIVNGTGARQVVPPVTVTVGGRATTVRAARTSLEPGEMTGFRVRLPVPARRTAAITAELAAAR